MKSDATFDFDWPWLATLAPSFLSCFVCALSSVLDNTGIKCVDEIASGPKLKIRYSFSKLNASPLFLV